MKTLHTLLLLVFLGNTITTDIYAQVIKGTYAIRNVATGIVLRIKDAGTENGTPIVAYSPVNWKCVTWDFKHQEDQTYQLQNLYSGKTFQPKGAKAADGAGLEEQPLVAGNMVQEYEFIPAGKNTYLIKLKGASLYLTPADNKGTVNAGILLAKRADGRLQQWTLQEQYPEM
ncbi:MAG TPA: RICIN domain-containing protein [Chitinophaga sp.]|uniref:RICIN domain-containing protein n=1 Tax=Chitinophaga sp. TaxID=1869181 RepID=UPI002CDECBC3|nr:RICIN domain-containing protein [Chitinophaga sp.]HVI45740.1 RICIN domain-containing protein [Chitinophaga sp.]